jgi:hypothetical protein
MTTEPRFPIGTRYLPVGKKHTTDRTVIDILKTYNAAGELVRVEYVGSYQFLGQVMTELVGDATVARGIWRLNEIEGVGA